MIINEASKIPIYGTVSMMTQEITVIDVGSSNDNKYILGWKTAMHKCIFSLVLFHKVIITELFCASRITFLENYYEVNPYDLFCWHF